MLSLFIDYSRFAIETTIAAILLAMGVTGRKHLLFRSVLAIPGEVLLCFCLAWLSTALLLPDVFAYFFLSLMPMGVLFILYEGSFWNRLFSFINGAMLRMCARKVFEAVTACISGFTSFGELIDRGRPIRYILYYCIMTALFTVFRLTLGRTFRKGKSHADRSVLLIYLMMMAINLVLNHLEPVLENAAPVYFIELVFCEAAYSALMLLLQYVLFSMMQHQEEAITARELWRKDRSQYEQMKENIETINMKCHDLRHHIREIQQNSGNTGSGFLEEVAQSISIYDSLTKTGSDALDVVLTEKKLRAESAKIQMTIMADGLAVQGMAETDIYSLFGNLLDNAIEYENTLPETEKRFISVVVKKQLGLVSIRVENYFEGKLYMENGLPVTTKGDRSFHGYGLKSVRKIVDKYGGTLSVSSSDSMFHVNILLESPSSPSVHETE